MKQVKSGLWVAVALGFVLEAAVLVAQEPTLLTRAQWLKKIGASVTSVEVLRATLTQIAPEDRVEFTQRMLKAVTRMPVGPEEKSAAFVRTAVACIGGVNNGTKKQVIAEVFAGTPVEFLPVLTEELAKRFDQGFNNLTDEQFEKIAGETLGSGVARNAKTDAPSVRNTFVILAFVRGAKNPALQNKLIAQLPDERMRNLAASWVPPALKDRNYEAMLAAADVEFVPVRQPELLRLIGHANLDRLLADLNANLLKDADKLLEDETGSNIVTSVWLPLPEVQTVAGGSAWSGAQQVNFGITRVPNHTSQISYPGGYQNQGTSINQGSGFIGGTR